MRRNILLAVTSLVAFFGLMEVALRLSGRVPTDAIRSPDLVTLDSIPGLFEPGQDFVNRMLPELPFHVRINSLGFRGGEFSLRKKPGTVRVLCLGDSYTFGEYVEEDRTFPAMLERLLNESAASSPGSVEVINGGASGFSIDDELIFLRDKASRLEPDIIVLAFCQNDVMDLARPRSMIETMRDHAKLKSTLVLGPTLKFLQRSAVFNGMQRVAAMIKTVRMRAALQAGGGSATPQEWDRYHELLGQFVGLVRQNGSRLLMVVWISADQIAGKSSMEPQARLAEFAAEMGFQALDLAPAIRALQERGVNPFFVPIDGHPNASGYEVAARETARRLIDLGYLGPPVPR